MQCRHLLVAVARPAEGAAVPAEEMRLQPRAAVAAEKPEGLAAEVVGAAQTERPVRSERATALASTGWARAPGRLLELVPLHRTQLA